MFDAIVKHIKTFIAQRTALFDISSVDAVAVTQANIITITGLDGEYTISGGVDGIASAGCMNDTHIFDSGTVNAGCFFGDDAVNHNIKVRRLNVGYAVKRDFALEAIVDTKVGNSIIVYWSDTVSLNDQKKYSQSEDHTLKADCTVGVMFKLDLKQIESVGCLDFDGIFINSAIGAKKNGASLLEFSRITDRFYAGENYVVDMEFRYTDSMFMNEEFMESLKHFDGTFGELTIN